MRRIRPDEIESAISRLDENNEAYLLKVFSYSLGIVSHEICRAKVISAHMMAFIHAGDKGKALKVFDMYRAEIVGLVGKVPDLDRALAHIPK